MLLWKGRRGQKGRKGGKKVPPVQNVFAETPTDLIAEFFCYFFFLVVFWGGFRSIATGLNSICTLYFNSARIPYRNMNYGNFINFNMK